MSNISNYFSNDPEWRWMFKNGIRWDEILPLYYPSYPTEDGLNTKEEVISFMEELLVNTGAWTATSVKDRATALDHNGAGKVENGITIPGPELQAFYKEARELGLVGMPLPREYGGLHVPAALQFIVMAQLSRSCMGSATQMAFFTSIAEMVHRFCDKETAERIIPQIINCDLSGSMNLTEPGCGSDLGMIKTTATRLENGKFSINGSKIFITNGGGGVAFVLAKIKGAPEGLDGISMFFVEQKIKNDKGEEVLNFRVAKNEEKMGMHASFTTEIVYENTIGTLIGKENEGFKYMLHLMNEARIAVGMQGLGGIEGSLEYAIGYAKERQQFGKPLAELPLMKRNLEDYTTERDAIRALLMDTISYYDVFQNLDLKKKMTNDLTKEEEEKLKEATLWTRKRTPLVKYYACETHTLLSQRAIQVLGGYGFMKEYPVERMHRDSFGPLLYEGTSQIQALMALKDLMKYAIKDPKKFLTSVFAKTSGANQWTEDFNQIHYKFKKKLLGVIYKALKPKNGSMFKMQSWTKEENIESLMIHAETICQGLSYLETLRVLCHHANIDASRADLFNRYQRLVLPRLEAIFTDWDLRA